MNSWFLCVLLHHEIIFQLLQFLPFNCYFSRKCPSFLLILYLWLLPFSELFPVLLQLFRIDRITTIIQGVDFFDDLMRFCLLYLFLWSLLYGSSFLDWVLLSLLLSCSPVGQLRTMHSFLMQTELDIPHP